jgi:hypothetical protein
LAVYLSPSDSFHLKKIQDKITESGPKSQNQEEVTPLVRIRSYTPDNMPPRHKPPTATLLLTVLSPYEAFLSGFGSI